MKSPARRRRPSRRSSCIGKVRYGASSSKRAARILKNNTGDKVHAYPCFYCGSYHVGHRPL